MLVQSFNSEDDFSSVESGSLLRELEIIPKVPEEFTPIEEVHHKVELVVSLKSIVQVNNECTLHLLKDLSFSWCM